MPENSPWSVERILRTDQRRTEFRDELFELCRLNSGLPDISAFPSLIAGEATFPAGGLSAMRLICGSWSVLAGEKGLPQVCIFAAALCDFLCRSDRQTAAPRATISVASDRIP